MRKFIKDTLVPAFACAGIVAIVLMGIEAFTGVDLDKQETPKGEICKC